MEECVYGHMKRARRKVRDRLAERGLSASDDDVLEMTMLALDRESFLYCLDACVDWAIDVVLGNPRQAA
jgi:hypothetical protein